MKRGLLKQLFIETSKLPTEYVGLCSVLPYELLAHLIMHYLNIDDWLSARLVCKQWNSFFCSDQFLWYYFTKHIFEDQKQLQFDETTDWRVYFMEEFYFRNATYSHISSTDRESVLNEYILAQKYCSRSLTVGASKKKKSKRTLSFSLGSSSSPTRFISKLLFPNINSNTNSPNPSSPAKDGFKNETQNKGWKNYDWQFDVNPYPTLELPRNILRNEMVAIENETTSCVDRFYFVGGYVNHQAPKQAPSLFVVDSKCSTCSVVERDGQSCWIDDQLWRHTITLFSNRYIYIFGGLISLTVPKQKSNSIHIFDTKTHQMRQLVYKQSSSEIPCPRTDHATTNVNDQWLYLFGGSDVNVEPLNDLWCFDLKTELWTLVCEHQPKAVPLPRSAHVLIYLSHLNSLLVYAGGECCSTHWKSNRRDICIFNLATKQWTQWYQYSAEIEKSPFCSPSVGTFPGVVMFPRNHWFYSIGGGNLDTCCDESFMFNLKNHRWYIVPKTHAKMYCGDLQLQFVKQQKENGEVAHCIYIYNGFAGMPLNFFSRVTLPWYTRAQFWIQTLFQK